MTPRRSLIGAIALLHVATIVAQAGGGRGIPNATPEQNAAVASMNTGLAASAQQLAAARSRRFCPPMKGVERGPASQVELRKFRASTGSPPPEPHISGTRPKPKQSPQ